MRIQIVGDSAAAGTLRHYLESLGYQLAKSGAAYTVSVEEGSLGAVVLEGVRGALADEAQHAIAELMDAPVEWRRSATGGETELRVILNRHPSDPVERGVLRALLKVTGHGKKQKLGWIKKLRGKA